MHYIAEFGQKKRDGNVCLVGSLLELIASLMVALAARMAWKAYRNSFLHAVPFCVTFHFIPELSAGGVCNSCYPLHCGQRGDESKRLRLGQKRQPVFTWCCGSTCTFT